MEKKNYTLCSATTARVEGDTTKFHVCDKCEKACDVGNMTLLKKLQEEMLSSYEYENDLLTVAEARKLIANTVTAVLDEIRKEILTEIADAPPTPKENYQVDKRT